MAVSRYNNTNTLLGGTRFGAREQNDENMTTRAGIAGKTRLGTARAALGNISNRTAISSNVDAKKGLKEPTKPGRVLTKAKGTTSLQAVVDKENDVKTVQAKGKQTIKPTEKDVVKEDKPAPCSPAPMDISSSSQGDAFSKQLLLNLPDIDADDLDNPQLVSEYVNDIYDYLRDLERKFPIHKDYLDSLDINGRMRGILIDWLIQVHLRFHLLQETLYLTVAIIDRFLQDNNVSRSQLQLVGVTSMLIASKYEEMYAPEIQDFVYITDNAYTKSDIRKMEILILKALDFNLGKPLPLHFLRRNSKAGEVDATKHTLAKYFMELTLVDADSLHFYPSQVAAAGLCLAMQVLDNTQWSDTLVYHSKYSSKELVPIMKRMAILIQRSGAGKLSAIKTKYQSSKFMRISIIPELKSQLLKDLAEAADS